MTTNDYKPIGDVNGYGIGRIEADSKVLNTPRGLSSLSIVVGNDGHLMYAMQHLKAKGDDGRTQVELIPAHAVNAIHVTKSLVPNDESITITTPDSTAVTLDQQYIVQPIERAFIMGAQMPMSKYSKTYVLRSKADGNDVIFIVDENDVRLLMVPIHRARLVIIDGNA